MPKIVLTEDNQRLDQVVYDYYGDLSMFDAVLAVNTHADQVLLAKGVELFMPDPIVATVEDKLW
ncbi:MAG: tail protein X [Shewanella sp.]